MFDRVFISRENNELSLWSGIGQNEAGGDYLLSPSFGTLPEAIGWWKDRGEDFILVRIDDSEYLWAGEGRAPVDARGDFQFRNLDDALANDPDTSQTRISTVDDQTKLASKSALGNDICRRREAGALSLKEVARRMEVDEEWLSEVEGGSLKGVDQAVLLRFVGATSEFWPNVNLSTRQNLGWVESDLLSLAWAIRTFEELSNP